MHFDKRLVVGLVSLSFTAGLLLGAQPAMGQELREMLMERMEAQQQMNPGPQQTNLAQPLMSPGQQQQPAQQQMMNPAQQLMNSGQELPPQLQQIMREKQLQQFPQQQLQQQQLQQQVPFKAQATFHQPVDKSEVSEITLHVKHVDGQQMVVTPKGVAMPLPGAGVRGDDVHVFIGANGTYWYKDRNDQTVDLTSCVKMMQGNAAAQGNITQIYNSQTTQSGGGAAAAGMGAMAGAVIGAAAIDSWNTVPYVEPVHYGAAGAAYYDRYGADAARYGAYRGQEYAHDGAAAGATAAHYGATQGQEYAERGAAAGASAAHYGAAQGQQYAERGAAAGASAAHYGATQGQEAAERGAAAGRAASEPGGFGRGGFGGGGFGGGGFGGGRFGGGFGGARRR